MVRTAVLALLALASSTSADTTTLVTFDGADDATNQLPDGFADLRTDPGANSCTDRHADVSSPRQPAAYCRDGTLIARYTSTAAEDSAEADQHNTCEDDAPKARCSGVSAVDPVDLKKYGGLLGQETQDGETEDGEEDDGDEDSDEEDDEEDKSDTSAKSLGGEGEGESQEVMRMGGGRSITTKSEEETAAGHQGPSARRVRSRRLSARQAGRSPPAWGRAREAAGGACVQLGRRGGGACGQLGRWGSRRRLLHAARAPALRAPAGSRAPARLARTRGSVTRGGRCGVRKWPYSPQSIRKPSGWRLPRSRSGGPAAAWPLVVGRRGTRAAELAPPSQCGAGHRSAAAMCGGAAIRRPGAPRTTTTARRRKAHHE